MDDACRYETKEFNDIIRHLQEVHGKDLTIHKDYSLCCSILFKNPLFAIEHYLSHTLKIDLDQQPGLAQALKNLHKEVLALIFENKV